jgi:hypothetical protein
MTKLKTLAVTALAAATIGAGGLVAAPTASAMPKTCAQAISLARAYTAHGNVLYAFGDYAGASYWYGRATQILEDSC